MFEAITTIGGISGIISLIGLLYVVFTKLGRMEFKIDTLWKVYGENILERAVKRGFAQQSEIVITKEGEELLGDELKQKIMNIVERKRQKKILFRKNGQYNHDLKYFIISEIMEDIKKRTYKEGFDFDLVLAAVILYIDKIDKGGKDKISYPSESIKRRK